MTIPDYLLIGHFTADLMPSGRIPGGTVSYALRTAHAFGLRTAMVTSAQAGEPLLEQLRPYAHDIVFKPAAETTTFENIYDADGRKQYVRGFAAEIGVEDIPQEWQAARLVHLAPIAGEGDPKIAHLFPNATVLLTLQGWMRQWGADGFVRFRRWFDEDALRSIDIVVFSEEDILEAPDIEQQFAQTVTHLLVTRAEKGGTYYRNGVPHTYTTPQVELVNPTGAGDVFAASLLASLPVLNYDFQAAIHVAARLGAICVTRSWLEGTPLPSEVQQALAEAREIHGL
ncbi:hypothetical protein FBR02_04285 [Anaerolineae bacterium CFX9]|jgi:sugar/nucleoside kinase (ribokinase family)|nr:hypothetical protein [Anaerolineae bacterium CFX9]